MPDNLKLAPAPATASVPLAAGQALHDHRILALRGRDAVAFAQAQFMNDVRALAAGHWQWSGWLTPKGRVIALFALLRFDDEDLWLLLPDANPATLADQLRRFVFRSKLEIMARADLQVTGAFSSPADATGARLGGDRTQGIELDMSGDGSARSLRIATSSNPLAGNPDFMAQWAACDLAHGLARLPPAQTERWTPQQLSLQRLHGYSVNKGCYPGQEIVARTHFLGKAKRELARLRIAGPAMPGTDVLTGDTVVGSLVASAALVGADNDQAAPDETLAVLAEGYDPTALRTRAGTVAVHQPLLGGLAR